MNARARGFRCWALYVRNTTHFRRIQDVAGRKDTIVYNFFLLQSIGRQSIGLIPLAYIFFHKIAVYTCIHQGNGNYAGKLHEFKTCIPRLENSRSAISFPRARARARARERESFRGVIVTRSHARADFDSPESEVTRLPLQITGAKACTFETISF